jgi:hypothetical protein
LVWSKKVPLSETVDIPGARVLAEYIRGAFGETESGALRRVYTVLGPFSTVYSSFTPG